MGCTVRDKHTRTNRRSQSVKPEPGFNTTISTNCNVEKLGHANLGIKPKNYHIGLNGLTQDTNYIFDGNGLEEILLKNLDFLYNKALNKLVALGYDDDVALKALLRNGHCYGGMDVLTNVLHNSLVYLNGGVSYEGENEETEGIFTNLRQLGEYSLAMMVCLLQQVKPHLSKGDALRCLLMSDLHVGRACAIEIPVLPLSSSVGPIGLSPALCRFHSGWGFGNNGMSEFRVSGTNAFMREIECPKRFNLSPSMKSLLNRNVSMFAAGFKANLKHLNIQSRASSSGNLSRNEESYDVISKFRDLNLDEKDEMVLSLVHEIKDLEKQVKERKEWAHQKAMQAARKVNHDLSELKTLRMERDEMNRLKGKLTLDKTTMDRLDDMEEALRGASGQVDRSKGAVRKLEIENAEIRAEMEASKLSASESIATYLEVAKREKKYLKKLLVWEKNKSKMQEDIVKERRKIAELDEALARVEADAKEAEEKWREERKSKELVLAHLDEERRLKEASEANNKRKIDTLRLKIELDFQRHKDDFQRLEQEYTRLKESAKYTEIEHQYNDIWTDNTSPQRETIVRLLDELDQLEVRCGRECMICMKDEVCIVFLPCAHQVVCAKCNESYGTKGKAKCPCCRVLIEQRVRVYGASS